MSDYVIDGQILTDIADAIREKTGESGIIIPEDMPDAISDISGGGGGTLPIDVTYLPNSDSSKILASSYVPEDLFTKILITGLTKNPIDIGANSPYGECFSTDLGAINTDVTCYCIVRRVGTRTGEILVIGVPYAMSNGNDPCFDFQNNNGQVDFSTWGNNNTWSNLNSYNYLCLAISVNATTKKARFFANGIIHPSVPEKVFNNSGSYVCFGAGLKDIPTSYSGDVQFAYCGVVKECESDATVIANMQHLMSEFEITA